MIVRRDRGPIRYVVKDERAPNEPEGGPSVFVLRPDDREAQTQIEALSRRADEEDFVWSWEYLRIALIGWENVLDERGEEVPFVTGEDGMPTDDTLSAIPMRYRMEIATEFVGSMDLTAADRKN